MDLRAASLDHALPAGLGGLRPHAAARARRPAECAAAPGLRLVRFADPEPKRTIGLVRRSLSVDDGWFGELATILAEAAAEVIGGDSQPR